MKQLILCALLPMLVWACQTDSKKANMQADIASLKAEIGGTPQPSPERLEAFLSSLQAYAEAYPNESSSATYLSQAAEAARLLGRFDQAVAIYNGLLARYPKRPEAAKALFMKAFTFDNDLKNLDSAKVAYLLFLEKHPEDDFADEADFLLKNLGKSPAEIYEGFEQK